MLPLKVTLVNVGLLPSLFVIPTAAAGRRVIAEGDVGQGRIATRIVEQAATVCFCSGSLVTCESHICQSWMAAVPVDHPTTTTRGGSRDRVLTESDVGQGWTAVFIVYSTPVGMCSRERVVVDGDIGESRIA